MSNVSLAITSWNPWWAPSWTIPLWINRELFIKINASIELPHIKDILGVRRSGKTTLLFQIIQSLISKGVLPNEICMLNFDDLKIRSATFDTILESIYSCSPHCKYLILDEIQNKLEWESWIRNLYDTKKFVQIFISGSNSSLLSEDLGRILTGRHLSFYLFPFSFKEILEHEKWPDFSSEYLHQHFSKLNGIFQKYLNEGGFPESYGLVENLAHQSLTQLLQDILARDISSHYDVDFSKLSLLTQYVMTNFTREFALRKISTALSIHLETVERYLSYLKKAFLIFDLPLFSFKQAQQFKENKKLYVIDNGLRNHIGFRTSQDLGKLVENCVFLSLKRQDFDLYYWKSPTHEVDFVITKGGSVKQLIQVCWDLAEETTLNREIKGLISAAKLFNLKEGYILNNNLEKMEFHENIKINFIPVSLWLIKNNL